MQRLINKQYKSFNHVSRYTVFPFYYDTLEDKYTYGITGNLYTDTPYKNHRVKRGDTLDSLALYYYNNPTYFWVIADFNKINDPYITLEEDSIIKIPTFSGIQFNLSL